MRLRDRRRDYLTLAAGWTAATFGAVHIAVAPWETRGTWSQAWSQGWWNTMTLGEPSTLAEAERSRAFWRTLGSFGAPMLILGSHILWSTRQGHRVPAPLGWTLLAWGLPFVSTLPRSPGWTIPVVGGLIVLGDRDRNGGSSPDQGSPGGSTCPSSL